MTKDNTMKNKSQLAKLLATENIEVQENQVQTASFDVVQRILTIPIFKEEQKRTRQSTDQEQQAKSDAYAVEGKEINNENSIDLF